jgi:hypothetical protein
VNHAEPELLSQAFDEIKVRIREANGCGLEFFVLHESLNSCMDDWLVVAQKQGRTLGDSWTMSHR